jgi:hypothetical protein
MDVANLREDIRHRVAGDLEVFKSVEELQDLVADLVVIMNDARLISLHAPISYHKPEADSIRKAAEDILDGRE